MRVVAMRGFHIRPPGDSEAWERVNRDLIGPSNEILWRNLPKLAGRGLDRPLELRLLLVRVLHSLCFASEEACCLLPVVVQLWRRRQASDSYG